MLFLILRGQIKESTNPLLLRSRDSGLIKITIKVNSLDSITPIIFESIAKCFYLSVIMRFLGRTSTFALSHQLTLQFCCLTSLKVLSKAKLCANAHRQECDLDISQLMLRIALIPCVLSMFRVLVKVYCVSQLPMQVQTAGS